MSVVSHITLICQDIRRSAHLFSTLLGFQEVYCSGSQTFSLSEEKFLLLGDLWLCLMQGQATTRSYNHIAFKVALSELAQYEERARQLNLEIVPSRPRYIEEGASLYFYDYDNHLFELHTGTLEQRLSFYRTLRPTTERGE
jgi:catechol 2,3-dioxygenase-like lactoylglutathione lyase family enzyme